MGAKPQVIRSFDDVASIRDNTVHLIPAKGGIFSESTVTFVGTGNVLHVEEGARLRGCRIRFNGDNAVVHLRASRRDTLIVVTMWGESVFYLGPDGSFNGEARFMPTERKHIIIGADAMFASRVAMRTADPHLVYSVETHQRVNPSASIWVGDHVWLGEDALLLKGARVGSGSILAARTVVTKQIPSNSSAAGVPARVVGQAVFWTRPSVHAWTRDQTARGARHPGDDFVFNSDRDALDVQALESQFDAAPDGGSRAELCRYLDSVTHKDRFALPARQADPQGVASVVRGRLRRYLTRR